MKYPISSEYRENLETAAARALESVKELREIVGPELAATTHYYFDHFGFEAPIGETTTALRLIRLTRVHCARLAELYATLPIPQDSWPREQSGKLGQHYLEAAVQSIQCGMRWGNQQYKQNRLTFHRLRHVFEFNGLRIEFNPWQAGEIKRVQDYIRGQLKSVGAPEIMYYVGPRGTNWLEQPIRRKNGPETTEAAAR